MPQNHRFIRVDNPEILCYGCEAPLIEVAFADLYGPRMVWYCQTCAEKRGMEAVNAGDPAPSVR